MTYEQANKKLLKIANGRYCSMAFEHSTHTDGEMKSSCRVYIDPGMAGCGQFWSEAFKELKQEMSPTSIRETLPGNIDDEEFNKEAPNAKKTATD